MDKRLRDRLDDLLDDIEGLLVQSQYLRWHSRQLRASCEHLRKASNLLTDPAERPHVEPSLELSTVRYKPL